MEGDTAMIRLGRPDLDDISAVDARWLLTQTAAPDFIVLIIVPSKLPDIDKGTHDF